MLLLWITVVLVPVLVAANWNRICRYNNDPHYDSFDNFHFDFHGRCEHTLTRPCYCEKMPECLRDFEVFGLNKPCSTSQTGSYRPACVHQIGIRLRENNDNPNKWTEFRLTRSPASVEMTDNLGNTAILSSASQTFSVSECVKVIVTQTISQNELLVYFSGYGQMRISMSLGSSIAEVELDADLAKYTSGKLCGICGQHEFNTGLDDFVLDNGEQFSPFQPVGLSFWHLPQRFYNHYMRFSDPDGCDPRGQFSHAAAGRKKRAAGCDTEGLCEKAFKFEGFAECLAELGKEQVDIAARILECEADFCSSRDDACSNIASLAATCEDAGYSVKGWREYVGCDLKCPANSKYIYGTGGNICIAGLDSCGNTDLIIQQNAQLSKLFENCGRANIRDGCVCNDGYVFDPKSGQCERSYQRC